MALYGVILKVRPLVGAHAPHAVGGRRLGRIQQVKNGVIFLAALGKCVKVAKKQGYD